MKKNKNTAMRTYYKGLGSDYVSGSLDLVFRKGYEFCCLGEL